MKNIYTSIVALEVGKHMIIDLYNKSNKEQKEQLIAKIGYEELEKLGLLELLEKEQ